MCKLGKVILSVMVLSFISLCVVPPCSSNERAYTATSVKDAPNGKLAITVKEGPKWLHSFRIVLLVKVTSEPQMAFWLENAEGENVTTVYVTHKTATQDWAGPPGKKKEDIKRPSSLPLWLHKHREEGIQPENLCSACHDMHKAKDRSTKGIPMLDAITAATPKWGFTREWAIPEDLKPGKYVFRAEINQAMDDNKTYKKKLSEDDPNYNGTSGQPSILWTGTIEIGGKDRTSVDLVKVGHGNPSGKDGKISSDLSKLTSALKIAESIKVEYIPPE